MSTQPPNATSLIGPNFRSRTPTLSATRYLPALSSLLTNGPYTWEVLPSVSRVMKFRVSVRENTPGGSCNAYQDMTITTVGSAGPFQITYPSATGITMTGNTIQAITWSVANTNKPPINTSLVNVSMSTDGGLTYPLSLGTAVANNGSIQIVVPNITTNTARVKVQDAAGTFFTISANNFSIIAGGGSFSAPTLSYSLRNPIVSNEVYIYYANLGVPQAPQFLLGGTPPGAILTLDAPNSRFIVSNLSTSSPIPNVTVIGSDGVSQVSSNAITIPGLYGGPTLTVAQRNPLNTTQAFVYYSSLGTPQPPTFAVSGISGATVRLNSTKQRFVISRITNPKQIKNVSINGTDGNGVFPSNAITIPGIL